MLHDMVVLVGINPDVPVMGEGEVHDGSKYAVYIRQTAYPVKYVVRPLVVQPCTLMNDAVCGLRRRHKDKVADEPVSFLKHISLPLVDIVPDHLLRRIPVHPLPYIAGSAHNPLGRLQDSHDGRNIRRYAHAHSHVLFIKSPSATKSGRNVAQ